MLCCAHLTMTQMYAWALWLKSWIHTCYWWVWLVIWPLADKGPSDLHGLLVFTSLWSLPLTFSWKVDVTMDKRMQIRWDSLFVFVACFWFATTKPPIQSFPKAPLHSLTPQYHLLYCFSSATPASFHKKVWGTFKNPFCSWFCSKENWWHPKMVHVSICKKIAICHAQKMNGFRKWME